MNFEKFDEVWAQILAIFQQVIAIIKNFFTEIGATGNDGEGE